MIEKLKTKRILGCIGIVFLLLGIILPYYKVSLLRITYSIKLWGYLEGKIIFALILANFLFLFKDIVKKYAPQLFNSSLGQKIENANPKLAIIPIILIVAFVVILYLRLDINSSLHHGTGFYFLWLGIICLIFQTFIFKKENLTAIEETTNISHVTILENLQECPNCHIKCEANGLFCPNCGNKL